MSLPPSNQGNVQTNMGPPMESGPGPADPALSAAKAAYAGSGYGPMPQKGGTINVGTPVVVAPQGQPAQFKAYVWNGQLYFVDNVTGTAYVAGPSVQIPQPGVYSPTK